jgi:inorganic triphosphatase YgiF
MQDLNKKITGDWFDIKENAENIYDLEDYFRFSAQELAKISQDIRLSVEEGIVEYKRKTLNPVFPFLETLKYDSRGFDSLPEQAARLTPLIYVLIIQRLIARGTIPLKRTKVEKEEGREKDIKAIIQDINSRIQENQELANHPAVKHIFMQMNVYKKELGNLQNLAPNVPAEKKEQLLRNFKQTFDEINDRIQENYARVVQEEKQKIKDIVSASPLSQYDLKPLSRLFFNQAGEVSRVRSTITFAAQEGFKTRESLVRLADNRREVLQFFEDEAKRYRQMADGDEQTARTISKAFGKEIIYILDKQANRLKDEAQLGG